MRQADDAGHHVFADVHRRAQRGALGAELRQGTLCQAQAGSVLRVDQQGATLGAFGQDGQVVHPAVARAHVTPPDQEHAFGHRIQCRLHMRQVGQHQGRRQFDLARRRAQHLGHTALQSA